MEIPNRRVKKGKLVKLLRPPRIVEAHHRVTPVDIPELYLAIKPNVAFDLRGRPLTRSLTLTKLKGFRWNFLSKSGRYGWERKPLVFQTIRNPGALQEFKDLGALQYLDELNEMEYMELIEWRRYLLKQFEMHKRSGQIAGRIKRELSRAKLMRQVFVDWYLEKGLDIPNIEFGDEVPEETKRDETIVAPEKYKEAHFKAFMKFVKNKKQLPAAIDFCKERGFPSPQGFLHQYRIRYLNKVQKQERMNRKSAERKRSSLPRRRSSTDLS